MSRSRFRARDSGICRGALLALLLALAPAGCIDTELDTSTSVSCGSLDAALGNVVFVSADLGSLGLIRCSGVLLTRTLVVTALGCTMVPNALADRYGLDEPPDVEPSGDVAFAGAVDAADCEAGSPLEDGSFATLFGAPLRSDVFEVYLPSEQVRESGHSVSVVSRVGTTRCSVGIALLELASGIGSGPLAVRVEDVQEDALLLSYLSVTNAATLERHDLPFVTVASSEPSSEPSFELPETCPEQSGAAVFSPVSGALVGILGASRGSNDCRSPGLGTGVRLAAFRRSLLAAAAPEALLLESGPAAPSLSVCASR